MRDIELSSEEWESEQIEVKCEWGRDGRGWNTTNARRS